MYAPSVRLSKFGRAAHDVGMAGLLGGNLFARLALHPSVTDQQRRTKRRLNAIGLANLASEIGLVAVNSALAQENFRRPPARRLFRRI